MRRMIMLGLSFCCISSGMCAHNCPHFAASETESVRQKKQNKTSVKSTTPALPASFGRTHFIVGASTSEVQDELQQIPVVNENAASDQPSAQAAELAAQAYFSPDDGLEKKLIELIEQEQDSMKMAVFLFTNGDIAQALVDAKKRGVTIELVTDVSCLQDKFNKINILHEAGIKVHVYKPEAATIHGNRMHHKYIVFGKNKEGKSWLWFGSFNLTKSADLYNQEGVILVDNGQLVGQFVKQFELLKARSVKYQKSMQPFSVAATSRKVAHAKKAPKKSRAGKNTHIVV